jgi:GT2 family glycosyltransferase
MTAPRLVGPIAGRRRVAKDRRVSRPAAHTTRPVLTVVIVNYRSWPDVLRLARGLLAAPEVSDGRCEVVIVDNASGQPLPPGLDEPDHPGLKLILHAENLGFAAGVNAGWRAGRGRWLLLLNPDVIAPGGFLSSVLGRVESFEGRPDGPPAVVGFRLLNADGTIQPSVGFEPSLLRSLRGVFLPRSRRKYQPESRLGGGPVPWVTGACALVDSGLLEALGGMDEEFFLYYEEVALCRAARGLGRAVEHDPSVAVTHLRPLQNRAVTPALRVITRASQLLYFRKHLPRRQFLGLSAVVAAEARMRGDWARWRGRAVEAAAWEAIGGLARDARRGYWLSAREVRDLASRFAGDGLAPQRRSRHRTTASA